MLNILRSRRFYILFLLVGIGVYFIVDIDEEVNGIDEADIDGESVGYSAWNISMYDVTDVHIESVTPTRQRLFSEKNIGINPELFPDLHGNMLSSVAQVPDEMEVTWRQQVPRNDQESSNTAQFGPYRIKVRSRIPEEILRQATQRGYALNIGVSVGKTPILLCWRLSRSLRPRPGTTNLYQGGDC